MKVQNNNIISSLITTNNKKTTNNKYFGVILIWEDICNKIKSNFSEKLENILNHNFNYIELKL